MKEFLITNDQHARAEEVTFGNHYWHEACNGITLFCSPSVSRVYIDHLVTPRIGARRYVCWTSCTKHPGSKWIVVHPFLHDEESRAPRLCDDDVRWLEPSALGRIVAPEERERKRQKEREWESEKRGKGRHKNQTPKERYPAGTRLPRSHYR